MYHRLDIADKSAVTGASAFIFTLIVLVGMILIRLVGVFLIVGSLFEKMKMIVSMALAALLRIMCMAAESQSRQCELADDEQTYYSFKKNCHKQTIITCSSTLLRKI